MELYLGLLKEGLITARIQIGSGFQSLKPHQPRSLALSLSSPTHTHACMQAHTRTHARSLQQQTYYKCATLKKKTQFEDDPNSGMVELRTFLIKAENSHCSLTVHIPVSYILTEQETDWQSEDNHAS